MATDATSHDDLLERLQDGDEQAAATLFDRYSRRLRSLAEKNLDHQVRRRVDGDDVVQSVFRTFFRRQSAGTLEIEGTVHLWRLLCRITVLKTRAKVRHHRAAMRDFKHESPEEFKEWFLESTGSTAGPEEIAMVSDLLHAALDGLPALYQELIHHRLKGYSVSETAAELGVSRQTVYRVQELMLRRLKQGIGDDLDDEETVS